MLEVQCFKDVSCCRGQFLQLFMQFTAFEAAQVAGAFIIYTEIRPFTKNVHKAHAGQGLSSPLDEQLCLLLQF